MSGGRKGSDAVRNIVAVGFGQVGGVFFRVVGGELQPGDHYICGRNTGPHLRVVKSIHPDGWVHATDVTTYPFDTWECVKVEVSA